MTEEEARTRPLNEVWSVFGPELLAGNKYRPWTTEWHTIETNRALIRNILTERIKNEFNLSVGTHGSPEIVTAFKNLGAAYMIAAWEVENKEKEATNGN